MTAAIPSEQLSEHFAQRMSGKRLLGAVFTTFQLDPAFFEQEVLPVFVDLPLSHAVPVRLIQLEDVIRGLQHGVAVYYDANGLVPGSGSPKLDVARVPVHWRGGLFHPKNVFALVEALEPDEDGARPKTLLAACLSANLTRHGWWENVEVAHVEEIGEGDDTRMRASLRKLFATLRKRASPDADHRALDAIDAFLRRETAQRQRRVRQGELVTHFWCGPESAVDFLRDASRGRLQGMHLEIISPFFDGGGESRPLENLIEAFAPRSCRVFLPKSADGAAQVSPELYRWVRALPNVEWGTLPASVTSLGKSADAGHRGVHAKVYRFFSGSPKEEYLFVGSPNLTSPALQHKGNAETAFLVQVTPARRPEFWLEAEDKPTKRFVDPDDSEDCATDGGTHLSLRFDWLSKHADATWAGTTASAPLRLSASGAPLFTLDAVAPATWTRLSDADARRLEELLATTALVTVEGERDEPGLLLVQETNMGQKPSILYALSAEDILRYWSLLTDAQRTAFLEARAPEQLLLGEGADLVPPRVVLRTEGSMFDRFAGVFHAFAALERAVVTALEADRPRDAAYRLFGQKYDSLGTLLARIAAPRADGDAAFRDPVDRYLVALCATQLLTRVRARFAEFWRDHSDQAAPIHERERALLAVRDELSAAMPDGDAFLAWYEHWFVTHVSELRGPA